MFDLIKMVFVLTLLSTFSGFSLSLLHEGTKETIKLSKLNVVYAPKITEMVEGFDNDPIKEMVELTVGKDERGKDIIKTIFPCKKNGETYIVAFDSKADGFNPDITVMLLVEVKTDTLKDIGVLIQNETKGLGTSLEAPFVSQFGNLPVSESVDLKARGGRLDGMSGATFSSTGVTDAVKKGLEMYNQHKDEILDAIN